MTLAELAMWPSPQSSRRATHLPPVARASLSLSRLSRESLSLSLPPVTREPLSLSPAYHASLYDSTPRVRCPGVRVLFALSGADEYVPPSVDCKGLSERFAKAAGDSAKALVIEGANHNLQTPDNAADTFVSAVGKLLDEAIDRVFSTDADF